MPLDSAHPVYRNQRKIRRFFATLISLLALANSADAAEQLVRVAVLGGDETVESRWLPTARYLESAIGAYDFEFASLNAEQIRQGLSRGDVEFVLADPGLLVDLREQYGLRPIATLQTRYHEGRRYPQFGAAILVRADRADIAQLADLKGKSFMAAHAPFGSFHLAWRELRRHSVHPFRDLGRIALDAQSPERAVLALRDGKVDVAAVPTGVLEGMHARGEVDAREFRLLNRQPGTKDFPYARSTPLYPDWSLAATNNAPSPLAQAVARALHAMASDDPAAQASGYAGWSSPPSYDAVTELYADLRLGPFRDNAITAYAREHWILVFAAAMLLLVFAALTIHVLRTNRRLAEEIRRGARTREEMQMFASALEQTAEAVMITDPHGTIEYVNPAFTHLTGYSAAEAQGQRASLLKSGQHDEAFYRRMWDTIGAGQVFVDEFVNRRKDGTYFWEQKSIMPLRDARGSIAHFVATGRDITEQRHAEEEVQMRREQLAHTARVNIIGEMTASIAHEISQPLTAIINYTQGSIRRLRTSDMDSARLLGVLEQIVAQAQRVTDAIVTLRRFVARREPQRVQADINALITQVTTLAAGETRKRGISIALDLANNLPSAVVDDVQIEQVVLNLLRNGAEALASADSAARELKVHTGLAEDGSIEVSISDTGPGLPPQLAAKLFEPFFTTKPDGVGLGLAISRNIIETHGGRIWVTPNRERGVTFRFTIPVETQTHER